MWALIKNNKIENIIALNNPADYTPPVDCELVEISTGGIGWIRDGNGGWVEPPPPEPVIPSKVTMRQARLQLAVLGVYQTVNTAVVSMGDAAQIEWEYAIDVERTNAITQAMIALLGWTEVEADAYFTAASLL